MIVHELGSAPLGEDILIWDDGEGEWRIGHGREKDGQTHWVDHSVRDGDERIDAELPLLIFTQATHWSPLPPKVRETCGTSWAEGARVTLDGVTILDLQPRAHCFGGGDDYSAPDVYRRIIEKLGYTVSEKEERS